MEGNEMRRNIEKKEIKASVPMLSFFLECVTWNLETKSLLFLYRFLDLTLALNVNEKRR